MHQVDHVTRSHRAARRSAISVRASGRRRPAPFVAMTRAAVRRCVASPRCCAGENRDARIASIWGSMVGRSRPGTRRACQAPPSAGVASGRRCRPPSWHTARRMVNATVKSWSDDEGWGVLTSPEIPGDVWAHFSALEIEGFRTLVAGQQVSVELVDLGSPIQDGYRYRAERVVAINDGG